MELIDKLFFSIFIFSIIVLIDLMVKFKRPLMLKLYFSLLVVCSGIGALIYTLNVSTFVFLFTTIVCKSFIAIALINIFPILYFPKIVKWINGLTFIIICYLCLLYNYLSRHLTSLADLHHKSLMLTLDESVGLPFYINVFRILIIVSFISTLFYFCYSILKKQEHKNIYFDKIKRWASFMLFFVLFLLVLFFTGNLIYREQFFSNVQIIILFFSLILFVYYRPVFLNRSALKISLGEKFNTDANFPISEIDFINEFYTKMYFARPEASLEHFANHMKINANELYLFIYNKYSISFLDLINKNRIAYFLDIIKDPKFKNYTVEALAKQVGFSSRQHLYKPFKKFHGGQPSDIIDATSK